MTPARPANGPELMVAIVLLQVPVAGQTRPVQPWLRVSMDGSIAAMKTTCSRM